MKVTRPGPARCHSSSLTRQPYSGSRRPGPAQMRYAQAHCYVIDTDVLCLAQQQPLSCRAHHRIVFVSADVGLRVQWLELPL
ncbi:hypothetical protein CKO41_08760 [Thiococcus pfennigii]|nr:hypothetical protein [Thiococcus pfennigii]MBK1731879.1 hypothetical protein [Thiococcus pfennigii]